MDRHDDPQPATAVSDAEPSSRAMDAEAPPPHATRVVVWNVPPAVERGRRFAVRLGVACSAGCRPDGWRVEVRDHQGGSRATAALGGEPWPGTDALYHAEVALVAPDAVGLYAWEAVAVTNAAPAGGDRSEPGAISETGASEAGGAAEAGGDAAVTGVVAEVGGLAEAGGDAGVTGVVAQPGGSAQPGGAAEAGGDAGVTGVVAQPGDAAATGVVAEAGGSAEAGDAGVTGVVAEPGGAADAHAGGRARFGVRVVSAPEWLVTVVAVDAENGAPVEGARVVAHPYRTVTDARGKAELRVPAGEYRLFVSGKGCIPFRFDGEVKGDTRIRAELEQDRELSDADIWS